MTQHTSHIIIIGAGIGGLTTGAFLAKAGYKVTIFEANTYPGGCAGTFVHKGFRFEAGATVAGGYQPNGPHDIAGRELDIDWKVHQHDPAWVVHLSNRTIKLCQDNQDVMDNFPETETFWNEQQFIADMGWRLSAEGLPWTPMDIPELLQLAKVGLKYFPKDLSLIPFAFSSVRDWLKRRKFDKHTEFVRFLDAQLLISAQTTTQHTNALYGATALDLVRQGVYHVEGGIGGIADQLAEKFIELGGEIHYRHHVTKIEVNNGQVIGVHAHRGKRAKSTTFYPADFVITNSTPWTLHQLLGEASPKKIQQEVQKRDTTYGAFVLHVGVKSDGFPKNIADHHQVVTQLEGKLGEGNTVFASMSPTWDSSRAPEGERAVTITTHTRVQDWWDLLNNNKEAYGERKEAYTEKMLDAVESAIPGFKQSTTLVLQGTPITYEFYTGRKQGMVGGFAQTSLFKARNPSTGIQNLRLVGDSIFPGQSTAGVTLGAMRVAKNVQRNLGLFQPKPTQALKVLS